MSDWRESTLGNEIELAYGKPLPAEKRRAGHVSVFGSNGIVGEHDVALLSGPGIVVGRKGTVGAVAYSPGPFWPIDTSYFVVNKGDHDWKYLYYVLLSSGLTTMNSHSAVPGLNREDAYSVRLWIPSLDIQQKIVRALDAVKLAATVEADLKAATDQLYLGALSAIFTQGLRSAGRKDSGIGSIPLDWETRRLNDLCDIYSGGTPRKSVDEYWQGDTPWVSGKDLKRSAIDDTIDHVSLRGIEAGSRLAPADAVLLLVRGMGLARDLPVATISRPMAFNQDVKALVSKGDLSGRFLRAAIYAGRERLLSRIVSSAHGTMTLNLDDVESFEIGCPTDPDEAQAIVDIVDALERKSDLHRRKHDLFESLFNQLLNGLMSRKIDIDLLHLAILDPSKAVHA